MRRPHPTALGVKGMVFCGCLLLAFLAAPYTNLFFLLIVFLAVTGTCSAWWSWRIARRLGVVTWCADPMPAGTGGPLRLDVAPAASPGLGLDLRLEEGRVLRLPLPAEPVPSVVLRLPPLPRGIHRVAAATLSTPWPFGLFEARVPAMGPDCIVVHPAPADLAAWRAGHGGPGAAPGGAEQERDLQPSSLREYRDGDEPRRIHWRATARRQSPVVKDYEGHGGEGCEVLLDLRLGEAALEEALSVVAVLAQEARDAKGSLLLHAQGGSRLYGAKGAPWYDLLVFLAGAAPLPPDGPPPPPVSPSVPSAAGGVRR